MAKKIIDKESDLSNVVYAAVSKICEGREANGSYRGNGHHLAQEITTGVVLALKDTDIKIKAKK